MGTPVKIAFFTVLITQTLAVLPAWPLGLEHAGLTLATSIGAFVNAGLLLLLRRGGYYRPQPGWPVFSRSCRRRRAGLAIVVGLTMGVDATWLTAGRAQGQAGSRCVIARRRRRRQLRDALRAGVSPRAVQSSRCDRSAGLVRRRRRGPVARPRRGFSSIAGACGAGSAVSCSRHTDRARAR